MNLSIRIFNDNYYDNDMDKDRYLFIMTVSVNESDDSNRSNCQDKLFKILSDCNIKINYPNSKFIVYSKDNIFNSFNNPDEIFVNYSHYLKSFVKNDLSVHNMKKN